MQKNNIVGDVMTVSEVNNMIDWFLKNGLTLEQAKKCIEYIAHTK